MMLGPCACVVTLVQHLPVNAPMVRSTSPRLMPSFFYRRQYSFLLLPFLVHGRCR